MLTPVVNTFRNPLTAVYLCLMAGLTVACGWWAAESLADEFGTVVVAGQVIATGTDAHNMGRGITHDPFLDITGAGKVPVDNLVQAAAPVGSWVVLTRSRHSGTVRSLQVYADKAHAHPVAALALYHHQALAVGLVQAFFTISGLGLIFMTWISWH